MKKLIWIVLILTLIVGVGAGYYFLVPPNCDSPNGSYPPEVQITQIMLADPLDRRSAEISGMDWYGDYLILLPQYFDFAVGRMIYAIPKADLLAYLDDPISAPLVPIRIPVEDQRLERSLRSFEGYESIAFSGNQLVLTIETSPGREMQGYVVTGEIAPDLSKVVLDVDSLQQIPLPKQIFNSADEAVLYAGDRIITLFEANGQKVNTASFAQVYDSDLNPVEWLPFRPLEYRVTDATRLDAENNFWVTNEFSVGSLDLFTRQDPLAETYGEGCTHARYFTVERLVELHYDPETGFSLTDTPPIQIQLEGNLQFRNWEAIARLDDKGFLIASDKFPDTILAFVPYP